MSMTEPDFGATSRAWSWRHAVAKSGLPPITRLVLHTLGLKMDSTGGSCYPPISELVDMTGLDKKTVLKHLDIAEANGWIEIGQHGYRGQKWKRNEYVARWPGRDLTGTAAANSEEGGGALPPPSEGKVVEMVPEGGGNGSTKVVEEFHQDKILPANIPTNSPAAVAGGEGLKTNDRKKIERDFIAWMAAYDKGDVGYGRNAWYALSAEERSVCIDRTPAYLAKVSKSDRIAAAVFLKNHVWEEIPEEALEQKAATRGVAKPFGKLWMGVRFEALLGEPEGRVHFTKIDEWQIESGAVSRAALLREKRRNNGWPSVNEMVAKASRGEDFICSLALKPLVSDFHQVKRGEELFQAWRRLHEDRGWPWPDRWPEYPWFPPVPDEYDDLDQAVSIALDEFLRQLAEGRDDDAA